MEEEKEKEVINIEDFFTEQHEEEGVWYEPRIKGVLCGFEFLITGTGTDKNVAETEYYQKLLADLEKEKDPIEKAKKKKVLEANRTAQFVKGFRASGGKQIMYKGKPLDYSVPFLQEFLKESPLIRDEIIRFAVDTANFIKREKKD